MNGDAPAITQEQIEVYQRQQEAAKQQRMRECSQAIAETLKQFDCDLVGVPEFKNVGGVYCVSVGIQIVAK